MKPRLALASFLKRRSILVVTVCLALAAGIAVFVTRPRSQAIYEARRDQLDLHEGALYLLDARKPFTGTLIENYAPGKRKLAIEIRDGKAHGVSRGWFVSGQQEVEEHFVQGVSQGTRTRWFENGIRKSEEHIEQGKLVGTYLEWYDNGQKAVAMTLEEGKPHGMVEAWHPSGTLKSRSRMDHGKLVSREFFNESLASATPPNR